MDYVKTNTMIDMASKLSCDFALLGLSLVQFLKENKIATISIWGAGKNGRLLSSILLLNNIEIKALYDDNSTAEIAGIKAQPFNPVDVNNEIPVIVAINSDNPVCDNILQILKANNISSMTFGSTKKMNLARSVNTPAIYTQDDLERLSQFKNCQKGKRAFILGNGPSLNVNDLNLLKNEITFAANKIYLAFDQTDWRPTYYCMEDHLVAQQNHLKINTLKGFHKFFPVYLKESVPYFDDSYYFNLEWPDWDTPQEKVQPFSLNTQSVVHSGATVVYTMLQLAWFMGIRELYVIGMDFHFQEPKETTQEDSKVFISEGENNHFHPDYRQAGEKWYKPNLERQIRAFTAARDTIEKSGGRIYNATRGGKLEVFNRINLDSVLSS